VEVSSNVVEVVEDFWQLSARGGRAAVQRGRLRRRVCVCQEEGGLDGSKDREIHEQYHLTDATIHGVTDQPGTETPRENHKPSSDRRGRRWRC
jgi:hypothetical protein